MAFKITVKALTPKVDELKEHFTPQGRRTMMAEVADAIYNNVMGNFDSEGKRVWAKWKPMTKSTKYTKEHRGQAIGKLLEGLRRQVVKSHSINQASVSVRGKIAKYHHFGTKAHPIFARDTGTFGGGKPLWFPYIKGHVVKKDGSRWYKGWMVEHPGTPVRPLVPDAKRARAMALRVINKNLKLFKALFG